MQPGSFAVTLMFGIPIEPSVDEPLAEAEALVGGALGVPLAWADDSELGGEYLQYAPRPLPTSGLAGVRVHANQLRGEVWAAPHRRDLPFVAEIELATASLLDAGRLTEAIYAHGGDRVVLASYVYSPFGQPPPGAELWRAHGAIFTTDAAGRRRWTPSQSPVGDDIRWDEAAVAPVVTGHIRFAIRAPDWSTAVDEAARAFQVAFVPGLDPSGGDHAEHITHDGSSLVVRRNALDDYGALREPRNDVAYLLDVTFRTQSLLDLGRLAAAVARSELEPVGHRAVGDLVRDRVPRILLG
jgi:hypothetical protein